jgi:type IV pilus assembly protein PilE
MRRLPRRLVMNKLQQRGVTLMELLTVVVIIAILASVAIPTYRNYLLRTQRAEGKTALLQLQAAQEKFYLNGNSYTDDVTGASPDGLGLPGNSETNKYDITVELVNDGQGYTASATPADGGGQEDDTRCGTLTISDTGVRGVVVGGDAGDAELIAECWR